jgi:hypothetical protein
MKLNDKAKIRDVESRLNRLLYCIRQLHFEELLTDEEHKAIYQRLGKMQFEQDKKIYDMDD